MTGQPYLFDIETPGRRLGVRHNKARTAGAAVQEDTAAPAHPRNFGLPLVASSTIAERRFSDEIRGVEDTCWSLMRELIDPPVVARFAIDGEPVSKARPRFVKVNGHVKTYTDKKTRDSENEVAWHFRRARPDWRVDAVSGFGVFAVFFAETFQRRDVDNMLKLVLDALNKVVWADDSQVTEVSGRAVRGDSDARTSILIYRTPGFEQPSGSCAQCGTTFVLYRSQRARKFCSRACSDAARRGTPSGQRRVHTCPQCGSDFTLSGTQRRTKKYCSEKCRHDASTAPLTCTQCGTNFMQWTSWKPSGAAFCSKECSVAYWCENGVKTPKANCEVCGSPVSRREYKRCRACAIAAGPRRMRGPRVSPSSPTSPFAATNGDPR